MSARFGWIGEPSPDPAAWLAPYSYPDAGGGWLFNRYPHILRILHPAYREVDGTAQAVTWAQIASFTGATVAPGASFYDITGRSSPNAVIDGVFDAGPEMGSLPPELIDRVYDHFDDAQMGLFWVGWGEFHDEPIRGCARVSEGRHGLSYQVVTATRSTAGPATRMRTPNFWWPADHSWCAATGIDDVETLIVSADRARLERVHADTVLETQLYSR